MLKRICLTLCALVIALSGAAFAQPSGLTYIDGLVNPEAGPFVNPGGVGDSLIYGYYNVRGNLNLFVIGNTSAADGAKVRIIFRNAKDSRECLDYSICLSKGDVYTAYLIDNGTTAAVCPFDTDTLTSPIVPATCQSFKYEGAGGVAGVTADDCREGYFEVIGLSSIPGYDSNAADGVPLVVRGKATELSCRNWAPTDRSFDVGNVLLGNNTIFDLTNLATYSANAVAVGNTSFYPVVITPGVEKSIPEAMQETYSGDACDLADIMFMKSNVIAPYDLIAGIGGETEMIVTFPTRLACHPTENDEMFNCEEDPRADGNNFCNDWCVPVLISVWDDKENRLDVSDFSPSVGRCLSHEVNVIKVGGSQIWNSKVANTVSVGSFDLGWIDIDLYAGESSHEACSYVGDGYVCSQGLPAIAFTTQSFVGGFASYMLPAMYKTSWYFD